jgi:hypothetical protein
MRGKSEWSMAAKSFEDHRSNIIYLLKETGKESFDVLCEYKKIDTVKL